MHPVLLQLGPITIYTYGFFVFLGVLAGYFICLRESSKQGIEKKIFADIFFWTIVFSFIMARITYVVVEFKSFLLDPIGVLFSRSGFVFYGGVIGGLIALHFLSKLYKIKFLILLDIFAIGIPIGHALGRLGCFSYGCCYGRPTNSICGILFPPGSPAGSAGMKVIPTQLFEAFFLVLIFMALLYISRKKTFPGRLILAYLFLYGIVRFILEFFRGDPRGHFFMLSTSQFVSVAAVITSVLLWVKWSREGFNVKRG